MNRKILSVFAVMLIGTSLSAQTKNPNIGYVYPAGAEKGTTVEVVIGGMNLQSITSGEISGKGVTVEEIKYFRPFSKLNNDVRKELMPILRAIVDEGDPFEASKKNTEKILQKLRKQKEKEDEALQNSFEEARKAGIKSPEKSAEEKKKEEAAKKRKGGRPSLEEQLQVVPGESLIYIRMTPEEVIEKIKSLSPIEYDCLCKSIFGRKSVLQATPALDQLAIAKIKIAKNAEPGIRELRLNSKVGKSNPLVFVVGDMAEQLDASYRIDKKNPPRDIKIPSLINGQIMPGEVDVLKFQAKGGKQYSFEVMGRRLVPYLGDAVPGWFQPVISVHDSKGDMLAFADDNLFDPDPVLAFTAPEAGDYELRIRDSIYRGREDFVYRIKAKEGVPSNIALKHYDLKFKIQGSKEEELNNSQDSAQEINFPRLITGTIDNPGDIDVYSFKANKGHKVVAEVIARRIDSPMDSKLHLYDSKGKVLAWNDDYEWPNIGIKTHHSDSYLICEIPETGEYVVKIGETQNKGGSEYKYKLRIDKARPGFTVYMNPSVLNLNSGMSYPVTLTAFREDGFDGAIEIDVKNAPKGTKLEGNHIQPGQNKTRMTLFVPNTVLPGNFKIELVAKAEANDKIIIQKVIPTEDIMQAFLWRHLVPTQDLSLNIIRKGWTPLRPKTEKVIITPGETVEVVWSNAWSRAKVKREFILELDTPPKGLSVVESKADGRELITKLALDEEAKSWSGNLIFKVFIEEKKKGKSRKLLVGYLPGIPCEITE